MIFENIFNSKNDPAGYIGCFKLKNWWLNVFTEEERNHMVDIFQLMGGPKDSLIKGKIEELVNSNPLSFLTTLTGWFDVGLSDLGIKQSVELKDKIKDKKFDVVFCSDLKRVTDSAKLTFEGVMPIIPDKRLRECNYGKYNAQSSAIIEPIQKNRITEKFPEGESYEDVKNRIADFLEFLKQNYDGKSVAIVAHKAPQLVLDVLLKNKTWEQAFAEDWRKTKAWQPGWKYIIE